MKWLSLINLSLLISNVASLGIILQPQTIVGGSSLCLWTRNATDPPTMDFDLRFVQNVTDVGLALANLKMDVDEQYGTASVTFPSAGQYFVKAVSGSSRNTVVGTSNEVTVVSLSPSSTTLPPSSSATPSSSTSLSPSPSTAATMTPQTTQPTVPTMPARSKRVNGAAIAGAVIGSLLIVGLLAALIVYINRRKDVIEKRWSFHKDLMVRRRSERPKPPPTIIPNMLEAPSNTAPEDVEQGLPSAVPRPLASGHVVPSPRGPRPSVKHPAHIKIVVSPRPVLEPAPTRTRRQQEIFDRIFMLRGQMVQIRNQPDANHILDDMQRQIMWLREQEQSPWALHRTDVAPPGHARYMTP